MSEGSDEPFSESEPVTERLYSGFRIEGNTIIDSGGYGILLRNTRNAVIRHNPKNRNGVEQEQAEVAEAQPIVPEMNIHFMSPPE